MTQKLVQISDLKFPNDRVAYNYGVTEPAAFTTLQVANMRRHRLVEKLVHELSEMFGRIGMHETCARCFGGRLNKQERGLRGHAGNGCCDACSMLGHSSCLNKPMVCATWMCANLTQRLWPLTAKFMREIRDRLETAKIVSGAYSQGIVWEHQLVPNLQQRRVLRGLIREVRAWTERRREAA